MNKKFRWSVVGILILIIILVGLRKAGVIGPDKTTKVVVEKVEPRTIVETVNATGKIYPEKEVKVSPDAGGEITGLHVKEGDMVKKGQVLAEITTHSFNLIQQKNTESTTTLTAPMNGVVSYLAAKKGERVGANASMGNTELMRIADFGNFEIRVDVSENDIPKVTVGDSAMVNIDAYPDKKISGIVTQVANSPNSQTMGAGNDVTNYKVSIRIVTHKKIGDADKFVFKPGMTGSADIQTQTKQNVLAVPINAVTSRNKKDDSKSSQTEDAAATTDSISQLVVFIYQQNGTVQTAAVKTGLQDTKYIEILEGLKGGEQVVSDPYTTISNILQNGMKVKAVAKDKLFTDGKPGN
jgi:HlyD family secretion protein